MTVIAARCQACDGQGFLTTRLSRVTGTRFTRYMPTYSNCPLCDDSGFEKPPVPGPENRATGGGAAANTRSAAAPLDDEDVRARQAVEGTRYENL